MWAQQQNKTQPATPKATKAPKSPKAPKGTNPKLQKTAGGKPPRKLWLKILKWSLIAGLSGLVLLVSTVAFVFWMYARDPNLPDYKKLGDYHPKQVTKILDVNDRVIGELPVATTKRVVERRTVVPYDKIPPLVIDAFIAAEDNSFWEHSGIDYWGMFRAFIANIRAGESTQGASTITQQIVKTLLLTNAKTFKRKIQEIILARRLEKAFTKQEIMYLYLNQIYFGNGRFGIQEAARFYFGKDVGQINWGEAAVLASLPKSPGPFSDALYGRNGHSPQRIKDRQIYVLNQLVTIGKLSQQEAQKWIDAPIQVVKDPYPLLNSAPEWVKLAQQELVAERGEAALDTLGGTIRTTLDPSLQSIAQDALQTGLRAVDKRQKIGLPRRSVKPAAIEAEVGKLEARLPKGGPKAKEAYDAVVTEVFDADNEVVVDLGGWKGALALGTPEDARFNPPVDGVTKKPSERFKPGDVVEVVVERGAAKHAAHRVAFPPAPEGAVVILEVKTRKVRAMVGGYALKRGDFNRAIDGIGHQPGSSFKPFVYAAAIDSGRYTPASTVNDAPEVFDLWKPKNYETGKFEGPVLLRHALAKSINTVAIRLTYDLKPETIAALANKMGITKKLPHELSLALGSGEVTPLEMTNAMATLAAGGKAAKPRFIDAIDGKATPAQAEEQVLRPEVAYVVLDMMQSVVREGTANKAAKLKIPVAGKTGTSNEARDVWFIGLTPDYAIGVWVGYDDNRPLGKKETGGGTAVPIFVDIMSAMAQPAKAFVKPAHIVEATIDRASGLLAPDGAPKASMRTEVFVEGSAPTEYAAAPGEVTEDTAVTGEYTD